MREYPKSIFTIDVEDYFNVTEERGEPPVSEWDSLPSIVESGFLKLLDLLDTYQVKATCFFLGYVAKKYPHLVKEAQKRGHEIASHGMFHRIVYKMSKDEFTADLLQSKNILEDICSEQVTAFRSPSFSLTEASPWFFETLAETGFIADSSVFPVKRDYGGYKTTQKKPYWITTEKGDICEFPISVAPFCGKDICFFGGGYLRLFPKRVILYMHKKLAKQGIPTLFYIHPREMEPQHPRLKMNKMAYFKSYVNLNTVQPKLEAILSSSKFITCRQYIETCFPGKRISSSST
ncbi:MAG TPA: polysaccharide deacetylase family protein [Candidatus Cloacimonas acidaminovorans]|nr:polysaccharide deacetylase family protein [Candidatus Cloacimonas acidaminovorans]HOM79082.1 polysaccharide deacetylase family protein [Candidatus Cloacimonas acidaminovorans]HPC50528.1 polysaccharide deacetylase family protein [Candidatus Cloacimonas acidaminovorans]HRS61134.1 polysaccharide deacetylase family protein [Candidatus Cloacimonas sp.]HRU82710.1 polysaccharide deacetylase family protein [Candidatus Cloacimonas sp.]